MMIEKLPPYYLITPDFLGNYGEYLTALEASLKNGIKLVQLRSKNLSDKDYLDLVKRVASIVQSYKAKLLLNGHIKLIEEVNADGVHFPSAQYMFESTRPIDTSLILSVACHTEDQIEKAKKINADLIVLCPVFNTPSSPQGIPLGWEKFSILANSVDTPVYALGGVGPNDYETACKVGAYGVAGIRAFWALDHIIA